MQAIENASQIEMIEKFEGVAKRQYRLVVLLSAVFMFYFALLIIGSGYFPKIFAIQLLGRVNVGLVFSISQYFFAGVIAYVYVVRMRVIDADLDSCTTP